MENLHQLLAYKQSQFVEGTVLTNQAHVSYTPSVIRTPAGTKIAVYVFLWLLAMHITCMKIVSHIMHQVIPIITAHYVCSDYRYEGNEQ